MTALVTFSYDSLPSEIAGDLRDVADRIRERSRRATADMIAIGADLIEVKKRLDHGQFLGWIDAEFTMSERSARYCMAAAQWAEGRSATVADLPIETVRLLSAKSTPPKISEQVVAALEAGERIAPEIVNDMVKQARKEDLKAKRRALMRRRRGTAKTCDAEERERLEQQREREKREQAEAAAEIVAILQKLPADDLSRLRQLMKVYGIWWDVEVLLKFGGAEPGSSVAPLRPDSATAS